MENIASGNFISCLLCLTDVSNEASTLNQYRTDQIGKIRQPVSKTFSNDPCHRQDSEKLFSLLADMFILPPSSATAITEAARFCIDCKEMVSKWGTVLETIIILQKSLNDNFSQLDKLRRDIKSLIHHSKDKEKGNVLAIGLLRFRSMIFNSQIGAPDIISPPVLSQMTGVSNSGEPKELSSIFLPELVEANLTNAAALEKEQRVPRNQQKTAYSEHEAATPSSKEIRQELCDSKDDTCFSGKRQGLRSKITKQDTRPARKHAIAGNVMDDSVVVCSISDSENFANEGQFDLSHEASLSLDKYVNQNDLETENSNVSVPDDDLRTYSDFDDDSSGNTCSKDKTSNSECTFEPTDYDSLDIFNYATSSSQLPSGPKEGTEPTVTNKKVSRRQYRPRRQKVESTQDNSSSVLDDEDAQRKLYKKKRWVYPPPFEFRMKKSDGRMFCKGVEILKVGEKFRCSLCPDAIYKKPRFVVNHLRSRHFPNAIQRLKCTLCDTTWASASFLKTHMISHTGEKSHMCHECGQTFGTLAILICHRRSHDESLKKFACEFCEKKFVSKRDCVVHTRSHTKEKPFMCEICAQSFKVRALLNVHLRKVHGQDLSYKCKYCSTGFTNKTALFRHLGTHIQCTQNSESVIGNQIQSNELDADLPK